MFEAEIVANSITGPDNVRLPTYQLQYPRFIHSELMTHRVFSRNAASSRAIPVTKLIEQVENDPAMPIWWGKNEPGMQARAEVEDVEGAREWWIGSAKSALERAKLGHARGIHKQIVNRVLEPFMWMKTIVTATEWDNFWDLRCHPDAQPEFQHLAGMMHTTFEKTKHSVRRLEPGDWHLPYVKDSERLKYSLTDCIKFSVARCARTSFLNHDKTNPVPEKDIELHDKLVVQKPAHASPAEHQATPTGNFGNQPLWCRNFRGWRQYRDYIEEGESVV